MSDYFTLHIGERHVAIADSQKAGANIEVLTAAFNMVPTSPFVSMAMDMRQKITSTIANLVRDSGLKKRQVNVVIPDSQSYVRIFDMPILTDKELLSAIRYQADQFIPIPIDKVTLDISILKKDQKAGTSRIFLVAAANSVLENIVQIVEESSLIPASIENEAAALLRLIADMHATHPDMFSKLPGPFVLCNFGNTSSSLYLIDNTDGNPIQVHNFSIGWNLFMKDIQVNYALTEEQAQDVVQIIGFSGKHASYDLNKVLAAPLAEMTGEIQRFLVSSKEKVGVASSQMYLVGEGSVCMGMDVKLDSILGTGVSALPVAEMLVNNQVKDFFANDWPQLAISIGGGLR